MFKIYIGTKINLKPSTRANYLYLWETYIKEEAIANKPISAIHKSEVLALYFGKKALQLIRINNLIHPTLEMAVDDDYIRKNPSKGVYRSLKHDGTAPDAAPRIALTLTEQKNFLRFTAKHPTYRHWLPILLKLLSVMGQPGMILILRKTQFLSITT